MESVAVSGDSVSNFSGSSQFSEHRVILLKMVFPVFFVVAVFVCLPVVCAICVGVLSCIHSSLQHQLARLDEEQVESHKQGKRQLSISKPLQHLDFMDVIGEECPICCCDFDDEKQMVETARRHCFHEECAMLWFIQNTTCPVCRDCC